MVSWTACSCCCFLIGGLLIPPYCSRKQTVLYLNVFTRESVFVWCSLPFLFLQILEESDICISFFNFPACVQLPDMPKSLYMYELCVVTGLWWLRWSLMMGAHLAVASSYEVKYFYNLLVSVSNISILFVYILAVYNNIFSLEIYFTP